MAMRFGVFDHIEPVPGTAARPDLSRALDPDRAPRRRRLLRLPPGRAPHAGHPQPGAVAERVPGSGGPADDDGCASARASTCCPLHHPLRLIEEISMLDNLSDGRLEIGVGRGGVMEAYFWGQEADSETNYARYLETLAIMREGLSHDHLTYSGRFHSFEQLPMYLRPLQKPYPPLWYMRNPVTAAMEGMHTIIVGSLDGLAAAVPRYRAAWEEHQGAERADRAGRRADDRSRRPPGGRGDRRGGDRTRPSRRGRSTAGTSPRRVGWRPRSAGSPSSMSTKDGSFGFVGDRPAGLPTRETRRDIDAELERFDQQKRATASQPAGRRGAGRHPARRARVHGRVPRHRRQLLRLLVPVGRPQPRAGDALDRAVRHRGDAQVHNARDHSARVASVSRSATAPPGRDERPGGLGAISGPPCRRSV